MNTPLSTPLTVIFFGPSGAGKGTQASLLQGVLERNSDLGVLKIEMGERLRGFASGSGNASKRVGSLLNEGKLVPEFIPSHIISSFLINEFAGDEHLIFDGMRRMEQTHVLDEALCFFGRQNYHVVVLELSKEDATERLKVRGRSDDTDDEKIARRLGWYEKETLPVIAELEKRGRVVHRIDGRPSIEEIHQNILTTLGLA